MQAMTDADPRPRPARGIVARFVRQGSDEREFDDRFWRELGPVKRLEAVWDLVLEASAWKGADPGQSRLQRSLLRVERR
jgi:hypothetical protein